MAYRTRKRSADRAMAPSEGERELARVLALLEEDPDGSLTIAALREHGVRAPAQAVYDLQLGGYVIDRVTCTGPGGQGSFGYRLHVAPVPVGDTVTGMRDVDRDDA
jgi:hypothetical protein